MPLMYGKPEKLPYLPLTKKMPCHEKSPLVKHVTKLCRAAAGAGDGGAPCGAVARSNGSRTLGQQLQQETRITSVLRPPSPFLKWGFGRYVGLAGRRLEGQAHVLARPAMLANQDLPPLICR